MVGEMCATRAERNERGIPLEIGVCICLSLSLDSLGVSAVFPVPRCHPLRHRLLSCHTLARSLVWRTPDDAADLDGDALLARRSASRDPLHPLSGCRRLLFLLTRDASSAAAATASAAASTLSRRRTSCDDRPPRCPCPWRQWSGWGVTATPAHSACVELL